LAGDGQSDPAGRSPPATFRFTLAAHPGKFPAMNAQYLAKVVDLTDPASNRILNMTVDEARAWLLRQPAQAVRDIEGSFALVAQEDKVVRLARSLDRPLRYFLAKRHEGPALVVANRIDAIADWLKAEGFEAQFQPNYTRMVPAHYVVQIHLVGCPDPDPLYERFFTPARDVFTGDLDQLGAGYIGALDREIDQWLRNLPADEPIGVCFSGGIDSGAVFLVAYHRLLKLGLSPSRLKAFTLSIENGPDLAQARTFLEQLGLGLFLEPIQAKPDALNVLDTIRIVEDYKALDVESAAMALALCQGIRRQYPAWKHLVDGDGGDENLKDYPIEENPELTIRSVVNNRMLYQEGWGLGTIKHSLTYSGGFSRACTRSYAPARHFGFDSFSPFTRPRVVEQAEGIPFASLTAMQVDKLYALKGEIVARGVKAVTGLEMPVFPKRRFQHGALPVESLRQRLPGREIEYRKQFLGLYS
jgi:asparagine synthase (glutamine-hydrolysing)